MDSKTHLRLRPLIERLARLAMAEDWSGDINPTQMAALRYLARANQYSRAPSHVAEYLGSTRGTVSQTLLALERKGLITEIRSQTDRRRTSYDLTPTGRAITDRPDPIDSLLADLPYPQISMLIDGLTDVLSATLRHRKGRPFGLCRTCRHHEVRGEAGYCHLLKTLLAPLETEQICVEQALSP
jgi:DNA-binding MarR family transcriptional regulator